MQQAPPLPFIAIFQLHGFVHNLLEVSGTYSHATGRTNSLRGGRRRCAPSRQLRHDLGALTLCLKRFSRLSCRSYHRPTRAATLHFTAAAAAQVGLRNVVFRLLSLIATGPTTGRRSGPRRCASLPRLRRGWAPTASRRTCRSCCVRCTASARVHRPIRRRFVSFACAEDFDLRIVMLQRACRCTASVRAPPRIHRRSELCTLRNWYPIHNSVIHTHLPQPAVPRHRMRLPKPGGGLECSLWKLLP